MDKNEVIRMTTPGKSIQCRTCKYRLKPIKIGGEKYERYNYGSCEVFDNKPDGVLWKGENCDLYQKE